MDTTYGYQMCHTLKKVIAVAKWGVPHVDACAFEYTKNYDPDMTLKEIEEDFKPTAQSAYELAVQQPEKENNSED
jgi:hypothetical protein